MWIVQSRLRDSGEDWEPDCAPLEDREQAEAYVAFVFGDAAPWKWRIVPAALPRRQYGRRST